MLIAKFDSNGVSAEIADMEERYNITLPQRYRHFLLRYNGGYTPRTTFKAAAASSDVKGLYGLAAAPLSTDRKTTEAWIVKSLLPIACDSFGNHILLAVAGAQYGGVFFSDHEKGEALTLIAKDFPSFLRLCKSEKIPPAAKRSIQERKAALIARGRGHIITPALIEMWQKEIDKYAHMEQEEVII